MDQQCQANSKHKVPPHHIEPVNPTKEPLGLRQQICTRSNILTLLDMSHMSHIQGRLRNHLSAAKHLLPHETASFSCTKLFCLFPQARSIKFGLLSVCATKLQKKSWNDHSRKRSPTLYWLHEMALHYGFAIARAGTGISIAQARPGTNK